MPDADWVRFAQEIIYELTQGGRETVQVAPPEMMRRVGAVPGATPGWLSFPRLATDMLRDAGVTMSLEPDVTGAPVDLFTFRLRGQAGRPRSQQTGE
jgi:hypothetical protein